VRFAAARLRHVLLVPAALSGRLSHAFVNTLLYLDYDRQGLDYPIVPIHVNFYGSSMVVGRSGLSNLGTSDGLDPPAPSPARCFDLGVAVASIVADSPYRAVLMASSSWSHGFLTAKHHWLYPDVAADEERYLDLLANRYARWRDIPLQEIEAAGPHEFLNWVCLAGAMATLDARCEVVDYVQSYVLNSDKCFALLYPQRT